MSFTDLRAGITKLNKGNYQLWKYKAEMLLSKDDLWDVVNEPVPSAPDDKWKVKNHQAMAIISLTVEDDQLIFIRKHDKAADQWNALKKVHERCNLTSKLYIRRKLYNIKLEKDQDMGTHINKIMDLVERLRNLGEEYKDKDLVALLLCSVPESYETLITALEARDDDELTLDFVTGKLIDEYTRRQESKNGDNKNPNETILKAQAADTRFKRESRSCFNCGKQGHIKRNCRLLSGPSQRTRPNQNTRPAIRVAKNNDVSDENYTEESPREYKCFTAKNEISEFTENEQTKEIANGYKYLTAKNEISEFIENEQTKEMAGEYKCFTADKARHLNDWYVDSGATSHICHDINFFSKIEMFKQPDRITIADGTWIEAKGKGFGYVKQNPMNKNNFIRLNNVLYAPKLDTNLLSVKVLDSLGYKLIFFEGKCRIYQGNVLIATAYLNNDLYKLNHSHRALNVQNENHTNCIHVWHRRLGHRSADAIWKLSNENLADGIKISKCFSTQICEKCIMGKSVAKPFPKQSLSRASKPFEIIHSDFCDPLKTPSLGNMKFILTVIDDYSRYTEIFLLKAKNEANQKLIEYFNKWANVFQRKPIKLRTDNGGEFVNDELNNYLANNGIQRQLTIPRTPQQNGVAERKNRSLLQMVRCMLLDANLDNRYWGEAATTAIYLQNRLPTSACNRTPFELWYDKRPEISHLRIFGSKAYVKMPDESLSKLDKRTKLAILLGYSEQSKGYRIQFIDSGKVTVTRNVTFEEEPHIKINIDINLETEKDMPTKLKMENDPIEIPIEDKAEILNNMQSNEIETVTEVRKSSRANKGIPAPKLTFLTHLQTDREPDNWEDLNQMEPSLQKAWKDAMDEEMESFASNNTWELTDLPENRSIIGCKWVYRNKFNQNGGIVQRKARLVAKGYSQIPGEDFMDTYAPVVRHTTLRTLLSIAASRKMKTCHLDVKGAFLNGDLQENIYMEQPQGYVDQKFKNKVCKLNKALYGLRQSAHAWNNKINDYLLEQGYYRSKADQCLYTKFTNKIQTYILIYVDDLLISSDDQEEIDEIRKLLEKKFKMKDLGEVSYYLGIEINKQKDGSYTMSQTNKIKALLKHYNLESAKDTWTPMETDFLRPKDAYAKELENNNEYRKAIGSLLYISTVTRPDIATSVGFLGRRVNQPSQSDWTSVKRVIKYLKTTMDYKLHITGKGDSTLAGYVDADWAGDCTDRKSTSGFAFFLNNDLIYWSSRKQSCVAASSTEAEYVAAANCCQELLWLRHLLNDFGYPQTLPTKLLEDNQGCIKLLESDKCHARTKHIDIKYKLLKDLVDKGDIKLEYCATDKMLADLLTKPLGRTRYEELRLGLGLNKFTVEQGC